MIGCLTGKIIEKCPPEILLDVQGVGYEVLLPMNSFYALPSTGEAVTLLTHLIIREDAHLLFGFIQSQERILFRELIKTNGVGPKLALAILSAMSVAEFVKAIEEKASAKLIKIPGIGRKTAERLFVELQGKFNALSQSAHVENVNQPTTYQIDPITEAQDALIALGYKPSDAEKMVKKVNISDATSEQLIREALKNAL